MIRIDDRTVELDEYELEAVAHYDRLLDLGAGIVDAARCTKLAFPRISDDMVEYLSE
jgi:hypothetical protein